MPRHAPELECSAEDQATLVSTAKSQTAESRAVDRARIILGCLEGKEIQQVARELKVSIPTVSKWRRRFALWGLRGLRDQARPGKPVTYDAVFRNGVLALLEEPPPPGMSHWDGPAVAERLNCSVYAVWRVLRRQGIYLQRRDQGRRCMADLIQDKVTCAAALVVKLVREYRQGVCSKGCRRGGLIPEPAAECSGAERG